MELIVENGKEVEMSDPNTAADGLQQLLELEEKINQAIDLLKATRADNDRLARENAGLRRDLEQQQEATQRLGEQLQRMEKERDTVRGRLQKLLETVDSLTRERSES